MPKSRKSQTWSFDVIIALFLFLGAATAFFYMTGYVADKRAVEQLGRDAEVIAEKVQGTNATSELIFVESNRVNVPKLESLTGKDYELLKKELSVSGDFCIHFEDADGNIILIGNKAGIGSDRVRLTDNKYKCGQPTS